MNNYQKDLWEKLAKKNSRYYINSDYGKDITEQKFRESGEHDYYRHILQDKLIVDNFPMHSSVILEIGCGTGRMTEFIARRFKKVIGTDISGEMIAQARERLKHSMYYVELYETDGSTLPMIKDNTVDIAFSYLVFQHIKTKEMVESNFREVHRVLRKGGLFKVLLRLDKHDPKEAWWSGVHYTEKEVQELADSIKYKLLKTERVKFYGLWVWLEKG